MKQLENLMKILKRDFDIRQELKNPINDAYTKELNAAMITLENSTGKILALVGGVDYQISGILIGLFNLLDKQEVQ